MMKKRMAAVLLLFSMTGLLLGGCGQGGNGTADEHGTETGSEIAEALTGTEAKQEDEKNSSGNVYIENRHQEYKDSTETVVILNVDTACPVAEGEGLENLAAGLESWYDGELKGLLAEATEYCEYAEEEYRMRASEEDDYFNPYQVLQTAQVERFDSKVTSISSTGYSYTGGAHGNSAVSGVTFDTASGQQLELEDLVEDLDAFNGKAALFAVDYVETVYGREMLFDDYETSIQAMFDAPVWYLNGYGLCIVCNEYLIGPHAMGTAYITIPYRELEGILKPEYFPETESFAYKFMENEKVEIDDSGNLLSLQTQASEDDEYSAGAVIVNYGPDSEQVVEFCEFLGDCYVIKKDADHIYLLINVDYASDDYNTYLMQLSDGKVQALDYADAGITYGKPVSTEGFYLSTKVDVMGTYSGTRYYTIGEDGKFCSADQVYDFGNGETASYRISLETAADIPAVLDGTPGFVPAGTTIYPSGCDLKGKFYFVTAEGAEGYFEYVMDECGFGVTINGVDENELFEMLPYAG